MSAVLLTGATTPFGRALARALLAEPDVRAVLAVAAEPGAPGLPADPRLVYVRHDLTRARDLQTLMGGTARDLGVEVVLHGAWHRRATDGGRKIRLLNVASTRELLRLAEELPTARYFLLRSYADVYRIHADEPVLIGEEHPLRLSTRMPQVVRDRLEADVTVCMRMGMSRLSIGVLRFAEIVAPDAGSQLFDYLSSRVCFRPLGYDPMLCLLSLDDAVRATLSALRRREPGIFNITGKDILPLSRAIELAGRAGVPVPGPLLGPLYGLRARALHTDFRYDVNHFRFHLSGVLDGRRAREVLGFTPEAPLDWARIGREARLSGRSTRSPRP